MSRSKASLVKAARILEERRETARRVQNERSAEIARKIPEIAELQARLSETGLAVIKAIGMGNDASDYLTRLSELNLSAQEKIKKALVKNGYPPSYLQTPYVCPLCGDSGFKNGLSCSCRNELLVRLAKEELARVSPSADCRFDNFYLKYYPSPVDGELGVSPRKRMGEILEYCERYADDFGPDSDCLYMHGATGLGKTHLSLAIANRVIEKGYRVVYGSAQGLLSSIERERFGRGSSHGSEDEILSCDLLIIDDLGSEFPTSFTASAVYYILNHRLNRSRPTIISANLTESELEEKYAQRTASRIIGSYVSLLFLGRDVRQLKNK